MSESSKNWIERGALHDSTGSSNQPSFASDTHLVGHQYHGDSSTHVSAPYRWTTCPEWEQTGRCKYNEMCYRRHGPDDTRLVPQGWEKKRASRSSTHSTVQTTPASGGAASAGSHANGSSHHSSFSASRQTAPRPAVPNPSKASVPSSPSHSTSGAYQPLSPTYSYSGLGHIGSPDSSYDSDLPNSPTVLSPSVLSPTITSPTMPHRLSMGSSPRDSIETGQVPAVEKPWIWQPCRHWQESGSCRYGDSCKYRHGPEDRRERPAPRPAPTGHHQGGQQQTTSTSSIHHLMRSTSNSSMESMSAFSATDSLLQQQHTHSHSRPNISLQPIGAQITSPTSSMGTLPPFQSGSAANLGAALAGLGSPQGSMIWDMLAPTMGRLSPPMGESSNGIIQNFSDQLRSLSANTDLNELQSELNSIQIQSMIAIQLQRETFLPLAVQDSMRVLLQAIAISSNPHEWQFALIRVIDFLNALLDHLFNKFVSVSISSPSSSFGQLPVDVPSKLSLIQPYIGGRLSGSISELYELAQRAAAGLFAPTQEEVITILEQLRRIAASTSKTV